MARRYTISAGLCCLALSLAAQQNSEDALSRSMVIEGNYKPQVTQASKEMPMPMEPVVELSKPDAEYETSANPYTQFKRPSMDVTGNPLPETVQYNGLAHISYGMRNNIDALFDLGADLTERDRLAFHSTLYGWNTKTTGDWRSDLIDFKARMGYRHEENAFALSVKADFGWEDFNYMPFTTNAGRLPDQTLFSGGASVGLESNGSSKWEYALNVGWQGLKAHNVGRTPESGSENLVRATGFLSYRDGDRRYVLEYSQKFAVYDWQTRTSQVADITLQGTPYTDYTAISLTPYALWHWDRLDLKTGFDMNIRNHSDAGFRISPNAQAWYKINRKFSLMGKLGGGMIDNDLQSLYTFSPYWADHRQVSDGYVFADALAGLVFEPSGHASVILSVGNRYTADELFQTAGSVRVYDSSISADNSMMVSMIDQAESNVFYSEIECNLLWEDLLKADVMFGAYNWYTSGSNRLLQMKPDMKLSLDAGFKVYGPVTANVSYRLQRMCRVEGARLKPVNDLGFSLGYSPKKDLSFILRGTNLLGSGYYAYAGYRVCKWGVSAGLTCRF